MVEALTTRVIAIDGEASLAEDYRYVLCGKRGHEDHPAHLDESLFGATLEDDRFPAIDLVTTNRPAEALDELRRGLDAKKPYTVAFVDPYNLAGIDGIDLLERIRALDPEIQIVVVTAESGAHPADLCERVAPADKLFLLHKPFHAYEIQQLTLALTTKYQRDRTRPDVEGLVRPAIGSESDLAAALERSPAAIVAFDQRDCLLAANSEMSRLFPELEDLLAPGTRYEELQWQMAQRLLPEDTLYRVEAWVRERLQWHRAGGGVLEQKLSAGRWMLLAEAATASGETYCHFYDITELKQREISRANAARMTQMAQAFGALCERLYISAADLRQQQSGGKVVSLRGGHLPVGAGTSQSGGTVAGELHGLMGKLQAISQRLRLSPESLALNQEIAETMREMGELIAPSVSVEVIGGAGLWSVLVDRERLRLILVELIKNACEAMEGNGRLTIETSNVRLSRDFVVTRPRLVAGDYVRLSIEDSGPGMSPELAERVFNPFFTSKSSRRHIGLGLSMAHGFINQSGGHIEIRDGMVDGTAVDIYLPRAQRATKPVDESDRPFLRSSE